MKIPEEIAQKITDGTMKELYNLFVTLEGEYPDWEDDYEEVRYGIEVDFEIYDLWEETKVITTKNKEGKVYINGKQYDIEDFRTEKEERRKVMVKAIMENIKEEGTIVPRGNGRPTNTR